MDLECEIPSLFSTPEEEEEVSNFFEGLVFNAEIDIKIDELNRARDRLLEDVIKDPKSYINSIAPPLVKRKDIPDAQRTLSSGRRHYSQLWYRVNKQRVLIRNMVNSHVRGEHDGPFSLYKNCALCTAIWKIEGDILELSKCKKAL